MLFKSPVSDSFYSDFEIELHGNVSYHIHTCNQFEMNELVIIYNDNYEAVGILQNYICYNDRVDFDDIFISDEFYEYSFDGIESNIRYLDDVECIAYEILPDLLCEELEQLSK